MSRSSRLASLIGIAVAFTWAACPVAAPARTLLPPEKPSHQSVPEAEGSGGSGEPLSNKLDRSGGVIKPPAGIDSGLAKSPPSVGSERMPVITPPGAPGGKSGANPK